MHLERVAINPSSRSINPKARMIVSAGPWHNRSRNTVEVGAFGSIDGLGQIVYYSLPTNCFGSSSNVSETHRLADCGSRQYRRRQCVWKGTIHAGFLRPAPC